MTTQSDLATAEGYATNARYQRPWYWYDWANSAYVTTTGTVLISPYLTALARADACPDLQAGAECTTDLSVLGVPIAVGAEPGEVPSR